MPGPGNSLLPEIAYYSGDPTGVSVSALDIPQGTIVLDLAGGPPRIKLSMDNSSFALLSYQGGAFTPSSIASTGVITSSSPSAGVGYATGAGGSVVQATNRTTGVTLNTITGQITTNNASLAAEAAAVFTVTNSACGLHDVPVVAIQSGSNGGNTKVTVNTVSAGSFVIQIANDNPAAGTAETGAIILNFTIIRGVSS